MLILNSFIYSCNKEGNNDPKKNKYFMGWSGKDDPAKIPLSLNFGFANPSLPSQIDLTAYLPPVGDQGQTGTCVAWACGYYAKTISEAIVKNFDQSSLMSSSNQMSPKYLFYAIPNDQKGSDCNGTEFTSALDVLQQTGVASMSTVPFLNLYTCSNSLLDPSWNSEAAEHKIKYYRKIDFTLASIKQQLANKYPVIIGISVSDNFMYWGGSGVLTSNQGSIRGLHALTVVGYDDTKGSNGAFRIVNSWTNSWGDAGFIWVDYNLFFSNFVYNENVYIIASDEGNITPNPDPTPSSSGVDLATWVFSDVSTATITGFNNSRSITFNVYNIGNQNASANNNWSFYYIYYNAYNANDYGVLFQDAFNNSVYPNTFNCPRDFTCNFNFSVPSGSSFAQEVFNRNSVTRGYFVPPLNGYYYLVMIADPGGAFIEQNEQNNLFYTTAQSPKYFSNGFSYRNVPLIDSFSFKNDVSLTSTSLKRSLFSSAVNENNHNAYTPEEIVGFIKQEIKNGDLKKKTEQQVANNSNISTPVYFH